MTILYRLALTSSLLSVCSGASAWARLQTVDLTDHKSQTTLGLPAYTSHSGGGTNPNEVVPFNPTVELLSAKFIDKGDIQVEIALINKTNVTLAVPISLDQEKVHKKGCVGRTEVFFSLGRKKGIEQPEATSPLEISYGSNCDLDSYETLPPGGRLVLRLSADRAGVRASPGDQVYVSLQLFRLADSTFTISGKSSVFTSNNAVVQARDN
jgi:hypothetical protein